MKHSSLEKLRDALVDSYKVSERIFSEREIQVFCDYYSLTLKWNPRLHLTTITEPESFVLCHLLEPAFASPLIGQEVSCIYDLGTGMGVPGIPLAILNPAIEVHLIDSDSRKVVFLKEAAEFLGLGNVFVANARIEDLSIPLSNSAVTVRAIEKMTALLPRILTLPSKQIFIFGGASLLNVLIESKGSNQEMKQYHLQGSRERKLFLVSRETD